MTRRCRCTGTYHTCGIQGAQSPNVIYVGQGGPRGPQGVQGPAGSGAQGVQGPTGTQGPAGAQGTQGVQGVDGGGATLQDIQDAIQSAALNSTDDLPEGVFNLYFTPGRVAYIHTQGVASNTWTINHDLNFYPNVTIQDSGGSIVEGEIVYTNLNSLTVNFQASFSGTAYLS